MPAAVIEVCLPEKTKLAKSFLGRQKSIHGYTREHGYSSDIPTPQNGYRAEALDGGAVFLIY